MRENGKKETCFFISFLGVCNKFERGRYIFAGTLIEVITKICVYCWVTSNLNNFIHRMMDLTHRMKSNGAKWLDLPWSRSFSQVLYYFITKNLSLCTEATDASSGFGCLLTSSVGVWSQWSDCFPAGSECRLGVIPMSKHTNCGWWLQTSPEKPADARKTSLTMKSLDGSRVLLWGCGLRRIS